LKEAENELNEEMLKKEMDLKEESDQHLSFSTNTLSKKRVMKQKVKSRQIIESGSEMSQVLNQ
jgi:hypothetical protein